MHPSGSCKCLHCGQFFLPDARNRGRQRHCAQPVCRKASKADSQRSWLKKPANADYFRGPDQVARVQAWRKAHPGYWKKSPRRRSVTLQDTSTTQPTAHQVEAEPDVSGALQDTLEAQPLVILGLIAHLTGFTLQDDIAVMTRTLHSRGRAVMGSDLPPFDRPDYAKNAKTDHRFRTGAARAGPI